MSAQVAIPRFAIQPMIPLDKEFLRMFLTIAVNNMGALPSWAEHFRRREEEEAVYFHEREWRGLNPVPAPHRVDLYTVMRGLTKVFDPKYDLTIPLRQTVIKALFEQTIGLNAKTGTNVLHLQPHVTSYVIQLALFDQVVYG